MMLRPLRSAAPWLALAACALGCSRAPEEPPATSQPGRPPAATRAPRCPSDPEPRAKLPTVQLKAKGGRVVLDAEFAHLPEDTERGLMYRTEMGALEGMLFKLPVRVQTFWMRNTCLSLDMLFVAEDGTIVGVLPRVPPLNESSRSVGVPSRYVLELNAGAAETLGLETGMVIELPTAVRTQSIGRD